MYKVAVLYVFHEYNNRVRYFIENGVFEDDNIDFIFICNNNNVTCDVPNYRNVRIMYRENIGHDFAGWSFALLNDNLYEKYEKFIFLNSTVIGPFLPLYYKNKWTQVYLDGLKDNVRLFGSTINVMDNEKKIIPHVQSYIFSMDQDIVKYLIDCQIFSLTNISLTHKDAVNNKEIRMSQMVIQGGHNIGCLYSFYNGIDFRTNFHTNYRGDLMYKQYMNKLWNIHELVFVKGNRVSIHLNV